MPCAPLILRVQENQRWSIVSEDVSDDIDPELAAHQAQQFNRMFVAAGTGETTNELNSQLDVNTVRWFGRFILAGFSSRVSPSVSMACLSACQFPLCFLTEMDFSEI